MVWAERIPGMSWRRTSTTSRRLLMSGSRTRKGDFLSRRGSGIGQGSISLHPAGWIHGPQPGSVEASLGRSTTEELAVMVDTFRPLALTRAAREVEAPEYPWTWAQRG